MKRQLLILFTLLFVAFQSAHARVQKDTLIVNLVPLYSVELNLDSLEIVLNEQILTSQTVIRFRVNNRFKYLNEVQQTVFIAPTRKHDRYAQQMHELRAAFLRKFPKWDQQELTFFLVKDIRNTHQSAYIVKGKSMGFVKVQQISALARALNEMIARALYRSESIEQSDLSACDSVRPIQQQLQLVRSFNFDFFDPFEDIRTNYGLIAYYFWKEDALGNIALKGNNPLNAIIRPYKRNTFSYHLQIDNMLFVPLFHIFSQKVSTVHLVAVLLLVFLFWILSSKMRKKIKTRWKRSWIIRVLLRIVLISCSLGFIYLSLMLINKLYVIFEVKEGQIAALSNQSLDEIVDVLATNVHPTNKSAKEIGSEIIIKNEYKVTLKQRQSVLYFDVVNDKTNQPIKMTFVNQSDSILLKANKRRRGIAAKSQYFVVRTYNEEHELITEKVYNHIGYDLTNKLAASDPPKRVLLFVNGYRPASTGGNLEESFNEVFKNGLEFPDSYNHIYTSDVHSYWHPWNQFDDLVTARIKPSETYYLDGHFSVSTSNHKSLLQFTSLAARFPERCNNPQRHHCFTMPKVASTFWGGKTIKTRKELALSSNKVGFNKRRNNGRIAGRNILQALNELPNKSKNDTLFIVAHSMGFAYSLGVIDVLRSNIQFGGFYIIAPENPKAGKVNLFEWQEVWQYGSNFSVDAPCLQDGIAPQSKVNGLDEKHRLYIPANLYRKKGFFDAHFIGYYSWIFEIEQAHKGAVHQH
jgi:diacylglycerol kinase